MEHGPFMVALLLIIDWNMVHLFLILIYDDYLLFIDDFIGDSYHLAN